MLLPIASAAIIALTGYTFHVSVGGPPPAPSQGELVKGTDLFPGFNKWYRTTFRIYHVLLYTIFACEIAICTILAQGSTLSPENHRMLNICPNKTSLDKTLYPQGRLPDLAALACALGISSSIFRTWAQRSLGKLFTWEVTIRPGHRIYTAGPYSLVRHPSYTGLTLSFASQAILFMSKHTYVKECIGGQFPVAYQIGVPLAIVWQGIVVANMMKRTVKEDGVLKKEFGKEWEEWAQRTKYRILPGIF